MLRNTAASQLSLFQSFLYDRPRAKTCCEIGRLKLSLGEISQAVFWYQLASKTDQNIIQMPLSKPITMISFL